GTGLLCGDVRNPLGPGLLSRPEIRRQPRLRGTARGRRCAECHLAGRPPAAVADDCLAYLGDVARHRLAVCPCRSIAKEVADVSRGSAGGGGAAVPAKPGAGGRGKTVMGFRFDLTRGLARPYVNVSYIHMRPAMPSAANPEAGGSSPWGGSSWGNQAAGPQAWGNQAQGGHPSWQNQGGGSQWQGPGWGASPFWHPDGMSRPMGIAFTVLGFILWWPIGLALLFYMIWSGRMGCRSRRNPAAYEAGWQAGGWGGPFGMFRSWCNAGPQAAPAQAAPTSGNRAFDEYRAET